MSSNGRILIVEDETKMRLLIEEGLAEAGHVVLAAAGAQEALELVEPGDVDVVVTDQMMPGMKGDELLAELKRRQPDLPVVIVTAFGTIESAVRAIKAGAYHYVSKPFRMEQLLLTVATALRERRLREEVSQLRQDIAVSGGIVASSLAMRRCLDLVRRAAGSDAAVLLLGESGVGKELCAVSLHALSPRRTGRFLAINCSAIPDTLLESQLFGHRKGSFTDAREDRPGLLQELEGGTLLLDEIGDMAPQLQSKLLRVLQEKQVLPIGAAVPVTIDVRVVAATHRDLESLIAEGRFREDLYYRLNVISIRIPPLRERPDDLIPLIAHFLDKHGRRLGRPGCSVSSAALQVLQQYHWPGNVRELENVIERALVLSHERTIGADDLPETMPGRMVPPSKARQTHGPPRPDPGGALPLAEVERAHIEKTLRSFHGNKAAAARALGMNRKTLYRKMQEYGLS